MSDDNTGSTDRRIAEQRERQIERLYLENKERSAAEIAAAEKARREDLRASLAATTFAVRIQQGAGNASSSSDRRKNAAIEAVADADALLAALGR